LKTAVFYLAMTQLHTGNMLPHDHPIHSNMALHRLAIKNSTFPITAATEKQPKPKNQTALQSKMGWEHFRTPHPHKERKQKLCWVCDCFLRRQRGKLG